MAPHTQAAGTGTASRTAAKHVAGPRRTGVPASPEERAAWVLRYVRMAGAISPGLYGAALGVDRRTARRDLQALVARGLIVAQGTTRDRRYTLRCTEP